MENTTGRYGLKHSAPSGLVTRVPGVTRFRAVKSLRSARLDSCVRPRAHRLVRLEETPGVLHDLVDG
jgi:hypothetical protein